jgi:hypothetical protein
MAEMMVKIRAGLRVKRCSPAYSNTAARHENSSFGGGGPGMTDLQNMVTTTHQAGWEAACGRPAATTMPAPANFEVIGEKRVGGQYLGIAWIRFGAGSHVAIAVATRRKRIDRVHVIVSGYQCSANF